MYSDAIEMSDNAKLWMNIYVKLLSLESLWTTWTTNKLSRKEVRQIRMDKITSKPILLIERSKGSWKLVPVRELFVILYEDMAWKKMK